MNLPAAPPPTATFRCVSRESRGAMNALRSFTTRLLVLLCASSPVTIGPVAGAQAPSAMSIPEQRQVLFDSVQGALEEYARERGAAGAAEAAKFRMLGVGSWQYSDAAKDIDVTFAHPDKAIERELVGRINTAVAGKAGGRGHQIKAIVEKDPTFRDLFRGDVGEAFVADYAHKSGGGQACYSWAMDEAGEARLSRGDTLRFWTDRGLLPPETLTNAARFVEENRVLAEDALQAALRRGETVESLIDGASSVAKYADNVDTWLTGRLARTYGAAVTSKLVLDADLAEQLATMRSLKGQSVARQREALEALFDASGDAALSLRLKEMTTRLTDFLEVAVDKVAVVDYLAKTGTLAKVTDISQAVRLKNALQGAMRRHGVNIAVGATSLYFIVDQYYANGAAGAVVETMSTLITMGVPEAAIPALVAGIAKDAFAAAGIEAGNYLVFNAINDAALDGAYDPRRPYHLFTWDESPFRGVTRETLYYKFPYPSIATAVDRFGVFVDVYIERVSAMKGFLAIAPRFASEGAGSFRPVLLRALLDDWAASRQTALNIQAQDARLTAGIVLPAADPLRVSVEGGRLRPGRQALFSQASGPAGGVDFTIDLEREFSAIRALRLPAGVTLYDTWGAKGSAAAGALIEKYVGDRFMAGLAPLEFRVEVAGATGWRLEGRWPVTPPLIRGAGAIDTSVAIGNPQAMPFQSRSYRIRLVPGADASPAARVAIRIRFKEEFAPTGAPTSEFNLLLTATRGQPPPTDTTGTAALESAFERATKRVDELRKPPPPPPPPSPPPAPAGNPAFDACVKGAKDFVDTAVRRSKDPGTRSDGSPISWFNCGTGASFQMTAPPACCAAYDAGRGKAGAWERLQQCGWEHEIVSRQASLDKTIETCRAKYPAKP